MPLRRPDRCFGETYCLHLHGKDDGNHVSNYTHRFLRTLDIEDCKIYGATKRPVLLSIYVTGSYLRAVVAGIWSSVGQSGSSWSSYYLPKGTWVVNFLRPIWARSFGHSQPKIAKSRPLTSPCLSAFNNPTDGDFMRFYNGGVLHTQKKGRSIQISVKIGR